MWGANNSIYPVSIIRLPDPVERRSHQAGPPIGRDGHGGVVLGPEVGRVQQVA